MAPPDPEKDKKKPDDPSAKPAGAPVEAAKADHPNAEVLLHPECPPETLALGDHIFSTSGMLKHAQESDCEEFIIGTEEGMVEVLERGAPGKKFYPVGGVCIQQKKD